jgi:hypothetical protein
MGAQTGRAPGQQQRRVSRSFAGAGQRDGDSRALQVGRDVGGRRARERRAEIGDIPPRGIVERPHGA